MLLIIINVIFVLSAVSMIVLILLQRGAGASAGSGFGGGASATVFGARGSANFLSKATKWLAVLFFSISLGLAWYASKPRGDVSTGSDLGIMGHAASAPTAPSGQQPGVTTPAVPQPLPAPTPTIPAPTPAIPAPTAPAATSGQGAASGTTLPVPAPQPAASPASPAASGK